MGGGAGIGTNILASDANENEAFGEVTNALVPFSSKM